jgi:hypothetical protein
LVNFFFFRGKFWGLGGPGPPLASMYDRPCLGTAISLLLIRVKESLN